MPTHKGYTKTEEVISHLKHYKSIDRATAAFLFDVYDLPDVIRRIRKSRGFEIVTVRNSSGNTRYAMSNLQ